MKVKLKKFTEFSKTILPNEAKYLASQYKFTDDEKIEIINRLTTGAMAEKVMPSFDVDVDKRKYSYVKDWIVKKLTSIDVDKTAAWILDLKKKILLDAIASSEEKAFLNFLTNYKTVGYNFQIVYELAQEYKPYLLIRLRYKDHEIVANFLNQFEAHYKKAKNIQQNIYNATTEITSQYTKKENETKYWERWLLKVFKAEGIDGKNRYMAFITLAFLYTNYNESAKLKLLFDEIDGYFSSGYMYSRRLLSNYYASRVLMHSKENELDLAEYYAYLSIRQDNNDTLMYVNNLVAILLKNKKAEEASKVIDGYYSLYKESHNYHQKIGFYSYRVRVLNQLHQNKLAEDAAVTFLKQYKKEVLKHRWHHFFTSYFNVLIAQEKYSELLKIASKFDISKKEKERRSGHNYIPNISWSISLSRFIEGQINSSKLLEEIKAPMQGIEPTKSQRLILIQVIDTLSNNLPEAFLKLKSYL
ncbi:hypothetical protein [Mangrovimonas spongiae]|uniref:Uncharacterized protein n=1 Tax=Mangrovimonas spongiae TaxID=2494697 RepID=A0A3R9NU97_9FLAO|nr:hypothetical protein [Mangrovimonas spongiae]RSK41887.1 hypothetical protein EJA19_03135 [Mangrovimonas spongiae]